jgi:hypothetical protein
MEKPASACYHFATIKNKIRIKYEESGNKEKFINP